METMVPVFVDDIRGVEGQLLVGVDAHQEGRDRGLQDDNITQLLWVDDMG